MNLTNLIIGVVLFLAIGGFSVYGLLAIRHAARFRYLSSRTVYLSLSFLLVSALLITSILGVYIVLLFN